MALRSLSLRQTDVLRAIIVARDRDGYPPTYTELMAAVGLRSRAAARRYLEDLERKGRIRVSYATARGIKVLSAEGA